MLALNIVRRSISGFLEPLEYSQGSPLGFLIIEKSITRFFGNQDYVLRAFPLFAGIVSIFLFFIIASRLLSKIGALFALSTFVFNDKLIYYATEVKQYSTDVFVTLLLLVITIPLAREGGKPKSQYVLWGFVAGLSVWLSHPALFVITGLSAGLIIQAWKEKNVQNSRQLGLGILLWVASFFLNYLIALRELTRNEVLLNYWRNYYMPIPPWRNPAWFPPIIREFFRWQLSVEICFVPAILFIIGIISFLSLQRIWGVMLSSPFLIALIVSAIQLYLFGQRLLLFSLPLVLLLISGGAEFISRIARNNRWRMIGIWIFFAAYFISNPLAIAFQNFIDPPHKEDIKPVLSSIASEKESGDLVCVYVGAKPAYDFYAPYFGLPLDSCILSLASMETPEQYSDELRVLSGSGRVWFIFSHRERLSDNRPEEKFRKVVNQIGRRIRRFQSEGAAAYLVQLAGSR